MLVMDTTLSDSQIKQLSLSISITDVLNCIKKDYDSYLNFLREELKDNEITNDEYKKELLLIRKLKKEQTEKMIKTKSMQSTKL